MSSPSFDLSGRVGVVTGGYGVLGGSIAEALARVGARTVIMGRDSEAAEHKADAMSAAGLQAIAVAADVLDEDALELARDRVVEEWGQIDVLVNAAGGSVARSRTDGIPVFDMPLDAFDDVVRLNLHGTVYPTMVFGEIMARQGAGSIINISSMASARVLSGIVGYSAAKAGVENFTRWMAVELAQRYGPGLRVNAIAPGFFVAKQNEAVLKNPDGSLTDRSRRILAHTPMGRFGDPADLQGTAVWLAADASRFVTGAVIPVDGGFSAYSGV
jgi:NAD(P)-dependent dehydrogenase (short-subunit alcohol dehydrogenase family)